MLKLIYGIDKSMMGKYLDGNLTSMEQVFGYMDRLKVTWWKMVTLFLLLPCAPAFGQQKEAAEKLVMEGVSYHDRGDFEGAIRRYDQALQLDKDNIYALAEKAMSLLVLKKYQEAIDYCEKAISVHPGHKALDAVYVTCGTAYDALSNKEKALAIYDEGIRLFPTCGMLFFNKGITLFGMGQMDEATLCFQQSAAWNPAHASTQNALARLCFGSGHKIPSIMAFGRFLVLEPQSERAAGNLKILQTLMKGGAEKTGKNTVTIDIDASLLADTSANGKPAENNFTMTELTLAISAALDYDKKYKKQTEVQKFIRNFEMVCNTLSETQEKGTGFYWDYYVPYYLEMKEKGFLETFAHIAYLPSGSADVKKWLKTHEREIEEFYIWSKSFQWAAANE